LLLCEYKKRSILLSTDSVACLISTSLEAMKVYNIIRPDTWPSIVFLKATWRIVNKLCNSRGMCG
jgi:hypothetical protein